MNRSAIVFLLSAPAVLWAGCRRHDDHAHAPKAPAKEDAAKAVDPICGMDVVKATAIFKSSHEGRAFFFCNAGCKERFEKEPGRYRMGYCGCVEEMPDCTCGHCKALAAKTDPTEPCPCHDDEEKEKKEGGGHKHDH
jgi:YHS domain-containing protein